MTETTTFADPRHDPRPWQDCTRADIRQGDLVEKLARGVVRFGVAHRQDENGDWYTKDGMVLTNGDRWPLRRIPAHTDEKETTMTEDTTPAEPLARTLLAVPEGHGAPHHDAARIKAGDYVVQVDKDGTLRGGHAHRQDVDGDWMAEGQTAVTWAALRADRPDAITVWPAPTPPAVEVEMPSEPCVLTDVQLREALAAGVALWTGLEVVVTGFNGRAVVHPISDITAATLPDGTRARRDGDRFVKVREGEK